MTLSPARDATIRLRDGRQLAYAEWGDPDGTPMLALHGAPGSRLWTPDDYDPGQTSADAGVRLITVDRPGYGRSDPLPAHRVVDWPSDAEQLLDALDVDRCPVVGASAGGPYALACGARISDRVTRVGTWPEIDRWLAADQAMRGPLLRFVREVGRQGVDGYAWDVISIDLPWGFPLGEVAIPTWVWHGEFDNMIDFRSLCEGVSDVTCVLYPGEGHLLRGHWGDVYEALVGA